jgi:threonine/homoserine/homoserine lactone efflux protein
MSAPHSWSSSEAAFGWKITVAVRRPRPGSKTQSSKGRGIETPYVAFSYTGASTVPVSWGGGAVIGDAFWAAVGILGSSLLTDSIPLRVGIGVLGVGILLFVAWNAYRASRQNTDYHLTDPPRHRTGFPVGVALSMANPFAVVFWLAVTASGALASLGVDRSHHVARIWFFVGLVVGAILYGLVVSALVAWARRFVTGKAMSKVNLGAALTLLGLAAFMAVRVVVLARKM